MPMQTPVLNLDHCRVENDVEREIVQYHFQQEQKTRIPPNFRLQSGITHSQLRVVIDYAFALKNRCHLSRDTMELAMSILMRFLTRRLCPLTKLQLLICSCLFLAGTYAESYVLSIGDFLYMAQDSFTGKELNKANEVILEALNYQIINPTPSYFLNLYFNQTELKEAARSKAVAIATYLNSLCWSQPELLSTYLPSELAYAVLTLTSRWGTTFRIKQVQKFTGYNGRRCRACIQQVRQHLMLISEKTGVITNIKDSFGARLAKFQIPKKPVKQPDAQQADSPNVLL